MVGEDECTPGAGRALTVDTHTADASAGLSRAAGTRAPYAGKAGITAPCATLSGRAGGACLSGLVGDAAGDEA